MLRDTLHRLWLRLTGEMTLSGEPTLKALVKRGLIIGDHCHLGRGVALDPPHCWHIEIGDHVTMAPEVQVLAHDASMKMHLGCTRLGKVQIGDHVFIGARSIILPNVTIGRNAIMAAGSVVSRIVPEGMVVGGVPASILFSLEDFLAKQRAPMAAWPGFDERYTLRGGVTARMKAEMNAQMGEGEAYIV